MNKVDGPFAEDVGMFKPHSATFKDANTIKAYIKSACHFLSIKL
jgi:hypothetical protein